MGSTAMPGDEFGGIRPVALRIGITVEPLDQEANAMLDLGSDTLQTDLAAHIDAYLAGHIDGQWACAVSISKQVG